ncbi:hypothetical protein AOLI_G00283110 [Acnodon oligacanthus]
MEDCVDRVGSARFVTKLDLLKGYWQVPLTSCASDISAFATPATPDFDKPFKVQVDASGTGAGAVLLQESSLGIDHPLCYFSRNFVKHHLAYNTIGKEALALLPALQHFEVYLDGSSAPHIVYTGHNPLVFPQRMSNTSHRLMVSNTPRF